eukprot:NODE_2156_length_1124_cov_5185.018054_g2138_i0.p2 GENE.NODE_2156_length_1124_cov_5185.018054_g2138_i0~~NODE_2156_length_1124_cov_5185.018054_g2138_i0.p2  ORF type:complete len:318 (+),score=80.71 NODE_2156_length_1124_cov_5185.018054_g2138_i0:77-1030(+)
MKACLVLAAVACALAARTLDDDVALFNDFKSTYNRAYAPSEEAHRLNCFRKNLDTIERFNAKGAEHHGINQFADLCADEFKVYHNLAIKNVSAPLADNGPAPTASSVDWRTKGAVTPIKNQGQCGSCWSFSSTGNMEGQWAIAGNALVGLSEEELVQCSKNGNMGCNGGLMDNAFQWVIKNGGIDSESDYPYTSGSGITGTCKTAKESKHVAKFSSYKDVTKTESAMATWTEANGPLSVAVDAESGWQTYSGGIMKTCTGTQLDHGVLVVGFGEEGSTPYWIVKNSWGASWGESGYIRLERGTNQCGISQMPSSISV